MSPRTTGLLALVAVVLAAWVYFYEIEGGAARDAASAEGQKIHAGIEASEVDAVSLVTLDGVDARFERQAGRWVVTRPVEARADARALDAIVHALVELPREGTVDAAAGLDGFGLGEEAPTLSFEAGGARRGLRIGRTTPVGGHRYVVALDGTGAADASDVGYVTSYRVNAFNRNFDDLRDRRPFDFEAGDVRTLRVGWPTGAGRADAGRQEREVEVALARDADGEWQMGSPMVARADQETLRDLVSNLAYLRASGFEDAKPAERSAAVREALEETAIRFALSAGGDHLETTARIAGEVDGRRLLEGPDGQLYWLPSERLDDFPRALIDYRFKQLASFEVSAARRIEMEFAPEPEAAAGVGASVTDETPLRVVATLEETGWSSADPSIDPDRASRMVREIAGLEAYDIVADEMGPNERASLGLAPPRARLRVEGDADPSAAARVLADLLIGRFEPDRGLFAQRSGDPTIYLLGAEGAEELPISAADFRTEFEVRGDAEDAEAAQEFGAESFDEESGTEGTDDAEGDLEEAAWGDASIP